MTWEQFTSSPSRFTAAAPNREERARLLAEVTENGFIDNYSGVRISSSGKRFRIKQATVWNLSDPDGTPTGQAATFSHWESV
ncbi:MEKHLA domain-containing protein [bacterium]|nr:MEKHLA domain-containing protein [Akkermansiaceae bacterium]MDB4585156.1 MEKHLA domain-containing protein [bacterium]